MAKSKPQTKTSKTKVANNYRHPESESLMRPDVGTQAQFKRKLPPKKYRYDDSLSPLLEWDEKGLKHWMEGHKNPERYGDVITDVYEALEALVKLVTERDADLSANREKFASVLGLPEAYKKMLKEYIDFGCEYRHSPETSKPRVYPSERYGSLHLLDRSIPQARRPNEVKCRRSQVVDFGELVQFLVVCQSNSRGRQELSATRAILRVTVRKLR